MDTLSDVFSRGVEQLLGRASGPLHMRLVMMPAVVTILAIRAGLRDAREGRPAFLWALLRMRSERGRLLRSTAADIGRVFAMAIAIDTLYQLAVLGTFHPVQALIVAVACALVPYTLVRGPVTRVARWMRARRATSPAACASADPPEGDAPG